MIPDYYKILNVPTDTSLDVIKKAYRTMAMRCHPDRGGKHKDMVLVNQAWEVLSNPQLRQNYDYARAHHRNREAQRRASADSDYARTRAETYPQKWNEFEEWINKVFDEYDNDSFVIFGWKFPSAGKSFLGWILILGGATLGMYVASLILPPKGLKGSQTLTGIALIIAGAWLGAIIHKFIKDFIVGQNGNQSQDNSPLETHGKHVVVVCPKCSHKFLLPIKKVKSMVKCPQCMLGFKYTKK